MKAGSSVYMDSWGSVASLPSSLEDCWDQGAILTAEGVHSSGGQLGVRDIPKSSGHSGSESCVCCR